MTVCTAGRVPLFGELVNGVMRLSYTGWIAHDEWLQTGAVRPGVRLARSW